MEFPNALHKGLTNAALLSIVIIAVSCSTQEHIKPVSPTADASAAKGANCDSLATTPNYRLWDAIAETSTITTDVREIADGSTRYCITARIADDPLVLGSTSCAPTPDEAVATFAYEFAAYLCGVTGD